MALASLAFPSDDFADFQLRVQATRALIELVYEDAAPLLFPAPLALAQFLRGQLETRYTEFLQHNTSVPGAPERCAAHDLPVGR
jgi:hypothetical protein